MGELVEFTTDDGPFLPTGYSIRFGEIAEFTNSSRIYRGYQPVDGLPLGEPIKYVLSSLSSPKHTLIKHMPVIIDSPASDEFIATLQGTSIAISAESAAEAITSLKEIVVEAFDLLRGEKKLSPSLQKDLDILETCIVQKRRKSARA